MTCDEFNTKYNKYLENGFDGLTINDPEVINYLDYEFEKELKINQNFNFFQIKIKFGDSRVYTNSDKDYIWEKHINGLINFK